MEQDRKRQEYVRIIKMNVQGIYEWYGSEGVDEDEYKLYFNDTATTEIYTSLFVGSVRCVSEPAPQIFLTLHKITVPLKVV